MTMPEAIIYGEGGYDPKAPDSNIIKREQIPDEPLDDHGALVTLLAVKGVITADDGAKLLKVEPAVLEAEAVAWKLAEPKPAPAKPKG
jgi:hypothetical protein